MTPTTRDDVTPTISDSDRVSSIEESRRRAEELIARFGDEFGPAWVDAVRSRIGKTPLSDEAVSRDSIYG